VTKGCQVILLFFLSCYCRMRYTWSQLEAFKVLSKSDLVKCERTSIGGPVQHCQNKIVTTVTISNESREPAGNLRFTQWNVKNENGSDLQMRFGLVVQLTKGQVFNYYPLQRERLYNYKPWELLIYCKQGHCRDDPRQGDVTCNWAYNGADKVRDSQV
ncbi:hypothetical protein KC19_10G105100, partial [Ceratodon purpureus]